MLDKDTRTAILRLRHEGHGVRAIADTLSISRNAVKRVVRAGTCELPRVERAEIGREHEGRIRDLFVGCKGNLVRVHEELAGAGVVVAYSTLTAFCRRHRIGVEPKERAGQYLFVPGEEMQHDTSPHDVVLGGKKRRLQCASIVLCFSRMIFARAYPTFNRFWCKVFLTDALCFFGGAAKRCMVDNTSVIVARGSGQGAVFAPEMVALSDRFGFDFAAHAIGDANRSARVERPFHYIENNFYPGRQFDDLFDLNRQFEAWCQKVNESPRRHLGNARPIDLFQQERTLLRALPLHVPEIYVEHERTVDLEGYVHLYSNRYSVDADFIEHRVKVRETKDRVRIFVGRECRWEHVRKPDSADARSTLPEHERQARKRKATQPLPLIAEEGAMRAASPELCAMLDALRARLGARALRPIRHLQRLWRDYPPEPLKSALSVALTHRLFDIERVETIVLRHVAGDFFRLPLDDVYDDSNSLSHKEEGDG